MAKTEGIRLACSPGMTDLLQERLTVSHGLRMVPPPHGFWSNVYPAEPFRPATKSEIRSAVSISAPPRLLVCLVKPVHSPESGERDSQRMPSPYPEIKFRFGDYDVIAHPTFERWEAGLASTDVQGLPAGRRDIESSQRLLFNVGNSPQTFYWVPQVSAIDVAEISHPGDKDFVPTPLMVKSYLANNTERLSCVGLTFFPGEGIVYSPENTVAGNLLSVTGTSPDKSGVIEFFENPFDYWRKNRIRKASPLFQRESVELTRKRKSVWPDLKSDEAVLEFIHHVQNDLMSGDISLPDQDRAGEKESGTPFSQFILKIHKRCPLKCPGCYVYQNQEEGAQTPVTLPDPVSITEIDPGLRLQMEQAKSDVMSPETVVATAIRIAEHVKKHGLKSIQVILHGGEPLLAGKFDPDFYTGLTKVFRMLIPEDTEIVYRIQTSGVGLTRKELDIFEELDINVGISLNGTKEQHDGDRPLLNGGGSHDLVVQAIDRLRQYREIYTRLYCVINAEKLESGEFKFDPIATFEAMLAQDPPEIDFLWPHITWSDFPEEHNPFGDDPTTNIADWLIPIFDKWFTMEDAPHIRFFESIIRLINGESSLIETLGTLPADDLMIETDGTIGGIDSLMAITFEMPDTDKNVFDNTLDEAGEHPLIQELQGGESSLSEECLNCPILDTCGGGLYTHRYSAVTDLKRGLREGFKNRSVYCADLLKFIEHVEERLEKDGGAAVFNKVYAVFASSLESEFSDNDIMRGMTIARQMQRLGLNPWEMGKAFLSELRANPRLREDLDDLMSRQREEGGGAWAFMPPLTTEDISGIIERSFFWADKMKDFNASNFRRVRYLYSLQKQGLNLIYQNQLRDEVLDISAHKGHKGRRNVLAEV